MDRKEPGRGRKRHLSRPEGPYRVSSKFLKRQECATEVRHFRAKFGNIGGRFHEETRGGEGTRSHEGPRRKNQESPLHTSWNLKLRIPNSKFRNSKYRAERSCPQEDNALAVSQKEGSKFEIENYG